MSDALISCKVESVWLLHIVSLFASGEVAQ